MTVSKLAKRCGLSRSAVLYYESIGLMAPPARTGGNYRSYSEADAERLRAIRAYRNAGLKLEDIRAILRTQSGRRRGDHSKDAPGILKRRLVELHVFPRWQILQDRKHSPRAQADPHPQASYLRRRRIRSSQKSHCRKV